MKFLCVVLALMCTAGLACVPFQHVNASEVIYDATALFTGTTVGSDSFNVAGPGTLTVTLTDDAWPAPLASLDAVVGTPLGLLGPEVGEGSSVFQVSGGNVVAQWFGTAAGALDVGTFGVKIEYTPSPVPLPASILLLLSGLGLLIWQRRTPLAPRSPNAVV